MTRRAEMLRLISDLHKDAYGFRPSADCLVAYRAMTTADLTAEWDMLCATLDREMEREAQAQARAAVAFEARLAEVIACGAGDRATAIRWMLEADDLTRSVAMYGMDYACFEYGLAYRYFEPPALAA